MSIAFYFVASFWGAFVIVLLYLIWDRLSKIEKHTRQK